MIDDTPITLIGTDGRVRKVPMHMKKELLAKGFRIIVNPKEEYYPQYDETIPGIKKDQNIIEDIPVDNLLEVDVL